MNFCVINFSSGSWYASGQQRLLQSLKDTGWAGSVEAFTSLAELGCPSHAEAPYAFKPAAFNRAAAMGYDAVLWCDSSVWACRSIAPVMEHIAREGHVFFHGGWDCSQWASDVCLRNMGVTRDEAVSMKMLIAGCLGLNLKTDKAREFLRRWTEYSLDGQSFKGHWDNQGGCMSPDPRCLGHRHDQSVASVLSAQLGMEQIVGDPDWFRYYGNPQHSRFRYGEVNDMSRVGEDTRLLAQGM